MSIDPANVPGRSRVSRRGLLFGGAFVGIGAAAAASVDGYLNRPNSASPDAKEIAAALNGRQTVSFYGTHQAGITTPPQAHATFVALDLLDDTDGNALRRMMQILTEDAARLTQGEPALADSEPELGTVPAKLTVTFGFGPKLVARAGGTEALPSWLGPLPSFRIDRLEPAWSDGDLLIQIASDDAFTVAHATRMLLKDARSFASVRWTQTGFRRAHGSEVPGTTMRNLFGQVDGTSNPSPKDEDFAQLVWVADGWLAGGTGFVLRRTHMDLDKWDRLDRSGRELAMGRNLTNGAPLTGIHEDDEPDFDAKTRIGLRVIPEFSHLRRARSEKSAERIYRRGYNYDHAPAGAEISDSGLLFASFQADVTQQFVPIQKRLDELDLLNEWTAPIGSAVFAIPPGCTEGGFIGETLLA